MKILENVMLAPYTTFGIGGPARWFAEAFDETEIVEAIKFARRRELPLFVLGGGSNLLVSDEGFDGLVLRVSLGGVEESIEGDSMVFRVAAGENWDDFVSMTVAEGCAGVECLAGIPGTVGGTPVQNVGAYGQEVSETIQRVRILDLKSLHFVEMTAAECGFSYRTSIFNSTERGRYLVARVDYRLTRRGQAKLRYAELHAMFEPGQHPTLPAVASAVRSIRKSKGMLLTDGDVDCHSAGSFFKNPVVPVGQVHAVGNRLGVQPPTYPYGDGKVKLPAAWLVEHAGFPKRFRMGRVGISSKHSLALVNLGGATAHEILSLRDSIQSKVFEKFGIRLEMEPVLVGF